MAEKQKEYGALWCKKSGSGKDFMTGTLEVNGEKIKVVAFLNTTKKNPNEPDWRLYESKPKEEVQTENALPTRPEEDVKPEDIPF